MKRTEEIREQIEKLETELENLENAPDLESLDVGTVLRFEMRFRPDEQAYLYVAVKVSNSTQRHHWVTTSLNNSGLIPRTATNDELAAAIATLRGVRNLGYFTEWAEL